LVTGGPLVLHLNGPPGVGKSTLARRWADEHPGTLLLDIDALRTWVSGWREDFVTTGAAIRPVAIAMLTAYVGQGGEVVLPQLIANESELARFEAAARDAGGRFVEVFLESDDVQERFAAREPDQPWLEAVHQLVEQAPADHLEQYVDRLAVLAEARPDAVRLPTTTGDLEGSYAALVAAVG
jgi:predicted kinase